MQETLTEKLESLKMLFGEIKEGNYSGRPITSKNDRLLAYSEFETRAYILKSKYLELPEKEAQPLLAQLKDLELEFRDYGIESAEKRYNQSLALNLAKQQLELSRPKCEETIQGTIRGRDGSLFALTGCGEVVNLSEDLPHSIRSA